MSDTITIKLTRPVKAAAKRLIQNQGALAVPYYDRVSAAEFFKRISSDRDSLARAVLAAMQKGGA